MTAAPRRAVSFGSLNLDIVHGVPHIVQEGETINASSRRVNVGGKGLNQAAALARSGVPTAMAGCVGPDGAELTAALAEMGVDTSLVATVDEPTGYAMIQLDPGGNNCIIVHGGANRSIEPAHVDRVLDSLDPGDLVAVQNETNLVADIIASAHDCGLMVAWNPSPIDEAVREVDLDQVDHLLVNEGEAVALAGGGDPEAALAALAHSHPDTAIVMTRGASGATWARGERREDVPAARATVVDTTGAGDTFTGYYLGAVLSGLEPRAALVRAAAAAGIAVSRPGAAAAIPTATEVDALLG